MELKISIDQQGEYSISENSEGILLNGNPAKYELKKVQDNHFVLYRNLKTYVIKILEQNHNHLLLNINGENTEVTVKDHITQILERLGMDMELEEIIEGINAPMPGTILEVAVKDGDEVKKGDKLIILEAMKMENVIKAPVDGTVSKIMVKAGENVEKNQPLLSF